MNKNKRIKITLDPVQLELLDSLCLRYHSTRTEIIIKALLTLASKRKHNVTILIREPKNEKDEKEKPLIQVTNEDMSDEEIDKLLNQFQ